MKDLLESSQEVITRCCLENGAIAASNIEVWPNKETKNYHYVWPRDGAYICLAAKKLGLPVVEKFFSWCENAESWKEIGLFYKNYTVEGKKVRLELQPDQNGTLLFALWDYCQENQELIEKWRNLISKSADGLCSIWENDHFNVVIQDIWEERSCFPDVKENFGYTLAACSKGLECADQLIPNGKWKTVSEEMKNVLLSANKFTRSTGQKSDDRIDASLLGLVWPFGIISAKDPRMVEAVKLMEEKIVISDGLHRYENDIYDGWVQNGIQMKKGSGYWPLLNFWMSLYYLEKGDRGKALKYHKKVLQDLKGKELIPEQIFDNQIQRSVTPLCWAQAMFVIIAEKLEN